MLDSKREFKDQFQSIKLYDNAVRFEDKEDLWSGFYVMQAN